MIIKNIIKSIQNSQHFEMKNTQLPLKNDISLILSSRLSVDAGSARSMIGEKAKHLSQKQISDDESEEPTSQSEVGLHLSQKIKSLKIENHSRHKSPIQTKLALASYSGVQSSKTQHEKIKFTHPTHIALTILEYIIYFSFLLGSMSSLNVLKYVDITGNVLCAVKIIVIHVSILCLNSKKQLQNYSDKNQPKIFYINRLYPYQLLQIWSILTTCILFIFPNSMVYTVINSLRLIRLFFPFLCDRSIKARWRAKVFGHIFKIVVMILVATIAISITLQLFLYNTDGYFCFPENTFSQGIATLKPNQLQSCGVFSSCSQGLQCRNIYSFVQNPEQKKQIQKDFSEYTLAFSKNLLYSMDATLSVGGELFSNYKNFTVDWLWFPIILALCLLYVIFTGIGIGEAIRYESLQDWKRIQQKNFEQQLKKSTLHHKKQKQRVSNISFNSAKPIQVQSILSQGTPSTQFTAQIQRIQTQLESRNIKQKLAIIFFNSICVTQVVLAIGDNINFDPFTNRCIGIGLAVIFILWTFGLVFTVFNYLTKEKYRKSVIKTNILFYEILAYTVMLSDYIVRIIMGKYLLEDSTQITPFAYTLISLRIMFVLYNNGFDPFISYYAEKMMQNFANNLPILGFLVILGILVGLLLSYLYSIQQFGQQIQYIVKGIGLIYGTGSFSMGNTVIGNFISIFLKFVGIMTNFYIAKHINMGYDGILQIDFKQWAMHMPNSNDYRQGEEKQLNCLRVFCKKLHNSVYYINFKAFLVLGYVILSLWFQGTNSIIGIIIFIIDIILLLDIATSIISCGVKGPGSYFSNDLYIKILYISSQIFCLISVFIEPIPIGVQIAFRASRFYILFACIPQLNQIYQLIKSVVFHPKIKIYKIVVLSFALLLVGITLTSFYPGQLSLNNSNKIIYSLSFAISYIYNLGWTFTNIPNQFQTIPLCLNMIFICLVLFLHVILTFMMVTYFVNRKVRAIGSPSQQIIKEYGSSQPEFYFHQPVRNINTFKYLKIIKIIIILASLIFLGLLSGNLYQLSYSRVWIAATNATLLLIEICIYLIENCFVKTGDNRWSKIEAALLLLSAPGTFFIIAPPSRFSMGLQLNIIIHICQLLSILRLLRIFPILANHTISFISSKLLRRIHNQLFFKETLGIFIFNLMAILSFSVLHSLLFQTDMETQFFNFLTGSIFGSNGMGVSELIYKFICTFMVLFPLRTLLLARVISSFLSNKPNQLLVLRDEIEGVICKSKILDKNLSTLFIPYNELYRLSAQIYRIFQQFSHKKKVKCLKYNQMMAKISQINIPIYSYHTENEKQSIYGVLLCDLIWHIFIHLFHHQEEQNDRMDSLFDKMHPKPSNITKSHIGTQKLCFYFKIRNNLRRTIARMRNKKEQKEILKQVRQSQTPIQ